MPGPDQVSAFVLAGGASTRMGRDKALLRWQGRTLIEHALSTLRSLEEVNGPPRIAGSRSELAPYAPLVPDLHPNCGPLSGIEAALAVSEADLVLFTPVDVPLLPPELLRLMIGRAHRTGSLMTVPRLLDCPQPLLAIYHRTLLPAVQQSIAAGDYKVMRIMTAAASRLGASAIDIFDIERVFSCAIQAHSGIYPMHRAFLNCNTLEDWAQLPQ